MHSHRGSEVIEINEQTGLTIASDKVEWNSTLSNMKTAFFAGVASGAVAGGVSAFIGTSLSAIFSPGVFPQGDTLPSFIASTVGGGVSGSLSGSFVGCAMAANCKIGLIATAGAMAVAVSAGIGMNELFINVLNNPDNAAFTMRGLVPLVGLAASAGGGALANGVMSSVATGLTSCCSTLFSRNKSPLSQPQIPELDMSQEYRR